MNHIDRRRGEKVRIPAGFGQPVGDIGTGFFAIEQREMVAGGCFNRQFMITRT
jgi:hypothetical protein